jgi:hypothetical protein
LKRAARGSRARRATRAQADVAERMAAVLDSSKPEARPSAVHFEPPPLPSRLPISHAPLPCRLRCQVALAYFRAGFITLRCAARNALRCGSRSGCAGATTAPTARADGARSSAAATGL